jgi:hypothetical protein
MDAETTGAEQERRGPAQGWPKGTSGNPAGRPPGSRHRALVALDAIGAEGAAAVLRAVVKAARGGDMRAAEILLRRLWPERRGRPLRLDLPPVRSAADLPAALGALAGAVAAGEATPEEAQALAGLLEAQRRAIETAELAERVAALEAQAARAGGGESGGRD